MNSLETLVHSCTEMCHSALVLAAAGLLAVVAGRPVPAVPGDVPGDVLAVSATPGVRQK